MRNFRFYVKMAFVMLPLLLVSCKEKDSGKDLSKYDLRLGLYDNIALLEDEYINLYKPIYSAMAELEKTSKPNGYKLDFSYADIDLATLQNNSVEGIISQPGFIPGVKAVPIEFECDDPYGKAGYEFQGEYSNENGAFSAEGRILSYNDVIRMNKYEYKPAHEVDSLTYYKQFPGSEPGKWLLIYSLGWKLLQPALENGGTAYSQCPFIVNIDSGNKSVISGTPISEKDIIQRLLCMNFLKYDFSINNPTRSISALSPAKEEASLKSFIDFLDYYVGEYFYFKDGFMHFPFLLPNTVAYNLWERETGKAFAYLPGNRPDSFKLYIYPSRLFNYTRLISYHSVSSTDVYNSEDANKILSRIFLGINPLQAEGIEFFFNMKEESFSFWAQGNNGKTLLKSIATALLADEQCKDMFINVLAQDSALSPYMTQIKEFVNSLEKYISDSSNCSFGFNCEPAVEYHNS